MKSKNILLKGEKKAKHSFDKDLNELRKEVKGGLNGKKKKKRRK